MKVVSLDHIVLTVRSLDATLDFYTRVLGMAVRSFEGGRLALRFGGQKINLHEAGKEFQPHAARATPGSADLCLLVEGELQDWLDHLSGLEVEVVEGPVRRTGALGPMTSVYVRDPDGNLIELATYA